MASATVERLIHEIENLKPAERADLRRRIDCLGMAPTDIGKLQELDRRLLKEGLLKQINPVDAAPPESILWEPISVTGKPVSETLVEERR